MAQGAVVDGVEQDPDAAAKAADVCRRVAVGDVEHMDFPFEKGSYDVIVMADLVEHLRHPVELMARLEPYLRTDGQLLLSTPNVANWSVRLRLLAGRWDYSNRGLLDNTHIRFFTLRTLRAAVQEAGYRVAAIDVTCPLPVLRRQPFNRIAHDVASVWKTLFAYQFIVSARPF